MKQERHTDEQQAKDELFDAQHVRRKRQFPHRLFFLRPVWVGWGCMITGAVIAGYGFSVVVRYGLYGHVHPLIVGTDAMPFSAACLFVLCGLAIFWLGWLIREDTLVRTKSEPLSSSQVFQLGLAFMSSLTLVIVAMIALFRR